MAVSVRAASVRDVPRLVELHMANLTPEISDFTQLGPRVVARFYRNVIERRAGSVYCAVDGARTLGFVMVTRDVQRLFTRGLLAGPGDVFVLLTRSNPVGLLNAFRVKVSSRTLVIPAVAELVYIVVDPEARGRQVGRRLIERAQAWFVDERLPEYELTVRADNASAVALYERFGHKAFSEYRKDGVSLYRFRKRFSPETGPSADVSAQNDS